MSGGDGLAAGEPVEVDAEGVSLKESKVVYIILEKEGHVDDTALVVLRVRLLPGVDEVVVGVLERRPVGGRVHRGGEVVEWVAQGLVGGEPLDLPLRVWRHHLVLFGLVGQLPQVGPLFPLLALL